MKNTKRNLAGMLALVAAHCLPATATAATTTTANVPGTVSFNVASTPLGGVGNCGIEVGSHNYGTTSFTTGNAATYSFTGTAQVGVASRTIIWSLVKQVRVGLVPIFHGLHRRTALER